MSAPKFFIDKSQLYMYTNDTSIQPVNVLNVTGSNDDPMRYKLAIGDEAGGLLSSWEWAGTSLRYTYGSRDWNNKGLFYQCPGKGIYL